MYGFFRGHRYLPHPPALYSLTSRESTSTPERRQDCGKSFALRRPGRGVARWMPKILNHCQKTERFGTALAHLIRYHNEGDDFLSAIVTGDESWCRYYEPETRRQGLQWKHWNSPPPKKAQAVIFAGKKNMASRMSLAAVVLLMVILLVVALSSAQEYPPSARPAGSGRECNYLCFLDKCNRHKCYYTCNRPRYCEEQALLLTPGSAALDGGVVSAFPSQADDVDDVPYAPSAPAATSSA